MKTIGVIGGMGPLASAEFIKTIYEHASVAREQEAPFVILHSDPSFPDRTENLLKGNDGPLLEKLQQVIQGLLDRGADAVVICCVTIHHLVPKLSEKHRRSLVSLPDLSLEECRRRSGKNLILCTVGARELGVFQRSAFWRDVADSCSFLEPDDSHEMHRLIYRVKKLEPIAALTDPLQRIVDKYNADNLVAGCTELHLFAKHQSPDAKKYSWVDPLSLAAARIASGMLG